MSETIPYNCDIPSGWAIIDFNNACDKISLNEIKIKQKEYLAEGKYPVIDQGQELIGGYFDEGKFIVPLNPPYIVFGDHTKVKKYINFRFIAGADGIKVLKSKEFYNSKLLFYFLHVIKIPDKGYARHFQFLEKSEIPLPPLCEQHRIVAKIEELFSELEKGVEALKTAQQQLKVYRQAVLQCAFEGKLTEEWRKRQKNLLTASQLLEQIKAERGKLAKTGGKTLKPVAPLAEAESSKLPVLPGQWCWTKIEYIGELGRGKSKHRPRNDKKLFGGPYPFVQTGEIRAVREVVKSYDKTYSEFGLSQSKLWPKGTLCITIAANIAETAFLGFDSCFPDSIVGFSMDAKLALSKFVFYFFKGNQKKIEEFAPATAQKNINLNILENLNIPYCSLNEQQIIVQEIETRLSVADKLEETITQSLQQAEALRQSILKKAFEGKLVPQDPNDEPASKLLERIKAEKTTQGPVKRSTVHTT